MDFGVITITIKLAINVLNMAISIVSIIYFSTRCVSYLHEVAQYFSIALIPVAVFSVFFVLLGYRNAYISAIAEELRAILHYSSCVFRTYKQ